MGRRAGYHWDKRTQAYRTDAGGTTRYFRGIARDDHAGIAAAFSDHLARLATREAPEEPDAFRVCEAFTAASRGVEERTKASNKERLLKFCLWAAGDGSPIGLRRAADLKASDLRAVLRDWEAKGYSDNYRAGICRSVKAAFAWAASDEGGRMIPANQFAQVRNPRVERSPERYAGRKEIADFLRFAWRRVGVGEVALARREAARDWRVAAGMDAPVRVRKSFGTIYRRFGRLLALMIRVGVHTGARPGDLCGAWWEDFDAGRGMITLPPDRHKTGKKTGRPLILYLPPALIRALARERDRPGRHPVCIFTHKRGGAHDQGEEATQGTPWGKFVDRAGKRSFVDNSTPLAKAILRVRKLAIADQEARRADALARGVPAHLTPPVTIRDAGDNRFVFYRLRHTRASDYLMRGGSSATVAALLGTSAPMIDTTYGHLLDDFLSGEAERLRGRRGTPRPGG